jgi:O-antigen/teichoic acid export membrane protein
MRRLNSVISFEKRLAKDVLIYGLKNILAGIAGMVNLRLDQAVMTLFVKPQQLGLYAVAAALSQGLQPVSAAFANVAFPRVTHTENLADAHRVIQRLFQGNLVVNLVLAFPLALIAPYLLMWLFGPAYADAGWSARILIFAMIFFGVNYVLGDSLRGLNAPLGPAVAEGVGTIVTAAGLYILLPRLGITGAALTSLLSYSAASMVLILLLWRHFGLSPKALTWTSPMRTTLLTQAWSELQRRWKILG